MYTVQRFPYCGMSMPRVEFETMPEAREYVAGLLARLRRRYPVQILARGSWWEVCEPDGAAMVPDACGTVRLDHYTHECRECGCAHETESGAAECCAYPEEYDNADE